jgi:hypothetical protein
MSAAGTPGLSADGNCRDLLQQVAVGASDSFHGGIRAGIDARFYTKEPFGILRRAGRLRPAASTAQAADLDAVCAEGISAAVAFAATGTVVREAVRRLPLAMALEAVRP